MGHYDYSNRGDISYMKKEDNKLRVFLMRGDRVWEMYINPENGWMYEVELEGKTKERLLKARKN